jgi:hypothetical protein
VTGAPRQRARDRIWQLRAKHESPRDGAAKFLVFGLSRASL